MKSFLLPLSLALVGFSATVSAEETTVAPAKATPAVAPAPVAVTPAPVAPVAAAPTKQEADPSCACNPCECMPCDCILSSLHHEDFYSDVSASFIQANHFDGWGVTARLGRWMNRDEAQKLEGTGHAVELEVNFFKEDYDRSVVQYVYDPATPVTLPLADTSSNYQAKVVQNRSVDVTMVPILLAWRYHGSMAGWSDWNFMQKMRWYVGAGAGFNICHTRNYATNTIYDSTPNATPRVRFFRESHTNVLPVAELSGGIGYAISQRCEVFGGLRGLVTDSRKFSNGTITGMKCPKLHVVYDLGMRFQW